jgi:hypothetical protein
MNVTATQFPNQKLTEAEKIKLYGSVSKWGQDTIRSLIGIGSQIHYLSYDDTYRKQINYNLVSGHINADDFKYVTRPYGLTKFEFPATFTNYNIITPKISLLEGEEAKRPFNFRVVATDNDSTNMIQREKTAMMHEVFKSAWQQELASLGINIENQEEVAASTPEAVNRYFEYDYQSTREVNAQKGLEYLTRYLEIQDKFNTGWRDLLITGEEVYYVGLVSDEPVLEVVYPVYFHYDRNPDLRYIEDSAWAWREFFVPPADIYDKYYDVLTEKEIEYIESIKGGRAGVTVTNSSIGVPIRYDGTDDNTGSGATYEQNSNVFVRVVHAEWKSLKKVGFVSWVDESGESHTDIVDEYYKPNPFNGETVEWKWINTVFEGTQVGEDIFLNVREKPNQYRSMDNPSKCKLGYVGVIFNGRNSQPYSLVEIMKPHQYLYNILLYRLELEIARAQGKKMIFDVAQIPSTEGFDMTKWLYYFNVLGIGFINSFEEGKGKFAGQRPTFNQFQQIDLSMARVIDQYVMMLDKIEDMVGEISGVSKQRQGTISSSETVGGVERSVQQSSYITEPLFIAHNYCKQHVLTSLLEVAKLAWSNGKKINFVMDDMTRILLDIDGTDIVNAEHGVFISNNAKDDRILQAIQQLAERALGAGQVKLKDLVGILESQNITKAKKILEVSEKEMIALQQQQQQAEMEMQQQQIQAQMEQAQAQMQLEDSLNQRDNDTKIQVALIQSETAEQAKMPEDKTGELLLKAKELSDKRTLKERELRHKETLDNRDHEFGKSVEDRKLKSDTDNERKRLEHEKEMDAKELAHRKALEKEKLAHEKELANKQLEIERLKAENEHKDKIKIEKDKLNQQGKEHEKEQKTKIETEKIKADAAVKAAKAKPKPKPSSGS